MAKMDEVKRDYEKYENDEDDTFRLFRHLGFFRNLKIIVCLPGYGWSKSE